MPKEMTAREFMLVAKLKELQEKDLISIKDIDDLMDQAQKLLMSYQEAIESRDKWRAKYMGLKKKNVSKGNKGKQFPKEIKECSNE